MAAKPLTVDVVLVDTFELKYIKMKGMVDGFSLQILVLHNQSCYVRDGHEQIGVVPGEVMISIGRASISEFSKYE